MQTDKEMIASGAWAKLGDKHYRHHSGAEITYDHNGFLWIVNGKLGYKTLRVARWDAERTAGR